MDYPSDSHDSKASPDFAKMPDGLVPAVIQDARTGVVLMLGYMNEEALAHTKATGLVTFYSRSKQRLWTKGESSGNVLHLRETRLDCDRDTILIKAEPAGPACHTGDDTCWGERNRSSSFLKELEHIIHQRKDAPLENSYTARLFAEGIPKIAQKVGEEAVETVIEALGERREQLMNETADLLYHLLVLMAAKEVKLEEVEALLQKRHLG
jgi:phosphoribosyl-ATP pyrophosphohydrolase/phosphoribosyl-AMP cyclohydrolase